MGTVFLVNCSKCFFCFDLSVNLEKEVNGLECDVKVKCPKCGNRFYLFSRKKVGL